MGEPLEPPHESVVLVEYPGKTRFAAQRFGQKWLCFGHADVFLSWAQLNEIGPVTVLVEDRAPSLVAELAATVTNLAEHIEQRAQEIAAPEIARAESVAVGRIVEVEAQAAFDKQRRDDVLAELRRQQLEVQVRGHERNAATVKRVSDLRYRWWRDGEWREQSLQLSEALAGES